MPLMYIDQAPHTYGYTMGTYAIQNEKQVSFGESTCGAVFFAKPSNDGGKANMNMHGNHRARFLLYIRFYYYTIL